MDWNKVLFDMEEQPLERLVEGYSHTSIFRRIAFIGDSLSSGEFETRDENGEPGYHDLYEYSWGQYIARKNGLTALNFSRGGLTALEYDAYAQLKGCWDPDKACQAYVIALGVNDVFNRGMELGSVADIDPEDWRRNKPTFVGNYAAIVSRYKEISPDAKFFFVTTPRTDFPTWAEKMPAFVQAIYDLADHFENAYVIDLNRYGPAHDQAFRDRFYLLGHLNPSGYILTAALIDSYIDYIVRHNPADFAHAGFINSGIRYK